MNLTHINRRIVAIGVAGALAVGVVGVSFAQAPSGGQTPTPANPTQPAGPRAGHPGHVGLKELAKASGLSESVFTQGFAAGKSIDQVLTDNSKSPATVQAAVLADIKTRLDKAVTDGKLTQSQEDKAYARIQQALPQLFAHVPGSAHGAKGGMHLGAQKGLISTAATSIGIDPKELLKDLRGGQTIAQVAGAKNVPVSKVIADMTSAADARIDQAVASGKLDPTKAAQLKTNIAQRIATLVNQGLPKHK